MEGTKKKKSKKKKGNQNKVTDDVSTNSGEGDQGSAPEENHQGQVPGKAAGEVIVTELNHGSSPEQNHLGEVTGNNGVEVQSAGVSESDIEPERQKIHEARSVKLQEEVRQLEDEKSLWLQKEASLEEKIRLLESGLEMCIQKELILEEKLNQIQIGNESSLEKQAILENQVKHVEGMNASKEVILENNIRHIEGLTVSWNQKEISIKENITRLDGISANLQMEVMELKESRDSLLQENQQLKGSMLALELRVQCLERDASLYRSSTVKITEMEATHDRVNELAEENAVLEKIAQELPSEKVDDVHVEPGQHAVGFEPSPTEPDHVRPPSKAPPPDDYASEDGENSKSLEEVHASFDIHNRIEDLIRQGQMPDLDESRVSEEVVSVPLDDIQVQDEEPQELKNGGNSGVPLSDAPLIGAPFRLISYFAKYVSGADLVDQN